jgi:hypothetical protein
MAELGCGLGVPSLVAARAGANVVATDAPEEALELVELNARENGIHLETIGSTGPRPTRSSSALRSTSSSQPTSFTSDRASRCFFRFCRGLATRSGSRAPTGRWRKLSSPRPSASGASKPRCEGWCGFTASGGTAARQAASTSRPGRRETGLRVFVSSGSSQPAAGEEDAEYDAYPNARASPAVTSGGLGSSSAMFSRTVRSPSLSPRGASWCSADSAPRHVLGARKQPVLLDA